MNLMDDRGPKKTQDEFSLPPGKSETQKWLETHIRASLKGMYSKVVELTPELATLLLANNPDNRGHSKAKYDDIVSDIVAGKWLCNGEPIIIAVTGELNDGQHRCRAVVDTGIAIRTNMTFGAARSSRLTVDTGRAKRASDFITMAGGKGGTLSSYIAKMLWQFDQYGTVFSQRTDRRPTTSEIQETYWAHQEEIDDALAHTPVRGSMRIGHRSMVAFALLLLRRKNQAEAEAFISSLCKGTSLPDHSPIYQAREMLGDSRNRRLSTEERLEIILRHWNAWRHRRKMKSPCKIQREMPEIDD